MRGCVLADHDGGMAGVLQAARRPLCGSAAASLSLAATPIAGRATAVASRRVLLMPSRSWAAEGMAGRRKEWTRLEVLEEVRLFRRTRLPGRITMAASRAARRGPVVQPSPSRVNKRNERVKSQVNPLIIRTVDHGSNKGARVCLLVALVYF